MTKEELAALLDGREYGKEITTAEAVQANADGLAVVYGASDDLMEFRGAICKEVDCWNGGTTYLTETGILEMPECGGELSYCPYLKEKRKTCLTIQAVWCAPDGPSWTYKTDIPHAEFTICEGGEPYCRGIVFTLRDLEETA